MPRVVSKSINIFCAAARIAVTFTGGSEWVNRSVTSPVWMTRGNVLHDVWSDHRDMRKLWLAKFKARRLHSAVLSVDELAALEAGTLEIQCLVMELRQRGTDAPRIYHGPGRITSDPAGTLTLVLYAAGPLAPEALTERPVRLGDTLPLQAYYELEARDVGGLNLAQHVRAPREARVRRRNWPSRCHRRTPRHRGRRECAGQRGTLTLYFPPRWTCRTTCAP